MAAVIAVYRNIVYHKLKNKSIRCIKLSTERYPFMAEKNNKYDVKQAMHTYCNPMSLPDIPRGKDEWYKFERGMFSHENKPASVTSPDYRSISDPTVFYYDNKWYLYPSYGMAWVTEDFENWKHVRTEPYCPKYSPCITPWKGKFLLTAWYSPLYVGDTPLGPFKEMGEYELKDGTKFTPCDPCIFTDDDGRIYLYAFEWVSGDEPVTKIVGYELDKDNPCKVINGPVDIVVMNPENKPWERQGAHYQNTRFGWVEGPHLLKYHGRYYMIYAAPDTCHPNYCMAVYYSDETPLSGFVCQKKNPLSLSKGGIVSCAGHGCVEKGPDDTLWAFYTIAVPFAHIYERRIGMDRVAVDENGELYMSCGVTDNPQYVQGYEKTDEIGNKVYSAGLVSLNGCVRPKATSNAPGREAVFATDENVLSFWQPADDDNAPAIECDLSGKYLVGAVRLFWRDVDLDYASGKMPEPVRFVLEGVCGGKTFTLVNASDNNTELNIDYRTFDMTLCEKVRLKILPRKLKTGLIDFAVFGRLPERNEL